MRVEPYRRSSCRVVIDTNVWISGALKRDSAPGQLTRLILRAGVPLFSPETFAELGSRLSKPKFDRYLGRELRQGILHDLSAVAEWVEISVALRSPCTSRR
jgi:putative PIN family toxin of toxin-antitoxin system